MRVCGVLPERRKERQLCEEGATLKLQSAVGRLFALKMSPSTVGIFANLSLHARGISANLLLLLTRLRPLYGQATASTGTTEKRAIGDCNDDELELAKGPAKKVKGKTTKASTGKEKDITDPQTGTKISTGDGNKSSSLHRISDKARLSTMIRWLTVPFVWQCTVLSHELTYSYPRICYATSIPMISVASRGRAISTIEILTSSRSLLPF
jgi:uncharacterized protein YjbJ (UPF0337 family)